MDAGRIEDRGEPNRELQGRETQGGAASGATVDLFRDEGREDYWEKHTPHPTWRGGADSNGRVRVPVSVLEHRPLEGLTSIPFTRIVPLGVGLRAA